MTNLRKYPKYQHKAAKQQARRITRRELTVWEICRDCADQMLNGIRCFVHNPTPEMRLTNSSTTETGTTNNRPTITEEFLTALDEELNEWP